MQTLHQIMVIELLGDGSELKKMIPWWRENFEIQKQRLTLFKREELLVKISTEWGGSIN